MKVVKLNEFGYEQALLGLTLSREQPIENMPALAKKLADKDGGHNKFLEFIHVCLDITAPRYWWQQMATYRVGNSWQSESTMYTIMKKPLDGSNFQYYMQPETFTRLNYLIENKYFDLLKNELPEGFLQRRLMDTNYKALRNIILQRRNHKLVEWKLFCSSVLDQLEHPEFVVKDN
jgi:hypothetical protein